MEGRGGAASPSEGSLFQAAGGGPYIYAEEHGAPRVNVPESRAVEGGGGAASPSEGGFCQAAWGGMSRNVDEHRVPLVNVPGSRAVEGGEELQVQVKEARLRLLGPDHPDTSTSMGLLASTYHNQARWKEAEKLQVQVKEAFFRLLGAEHPDTLRSMGCCDKIQ